MIPVSLILLITSAPTKKILNTFFLFYPLDDDGKNNLPIEPAKPEEDDDCYGIMVCIYLSMHFSSNKTLDSYSGGLSELNKTKILYVIQI